MGSLNGKVAIVTGAAAGIGKASALLFAQEGASLLLVDLSESVEQTAEHIRSEGGSARAKCLDSSDEDAVASVISDAIKEYGRLDVILANAGISGGLKSLFEQDAQDWSEVLKVNLIGAFLAIKYGAKVMAEQGGGSIICTASIAGLRSGAGGPAYSASKAGVINLVQVAAQQLSSSNVRVNAICPGLVETGMTSMIFDAARGSGKEDRLGRLNPLRRAGLAEEIARAALFLASDASSYVNGHALVADGGLSTSHPVPRQEFGVTAC